MIWLVENRDKSEIWAIQYFFIFILEGGEAWLSVEKAPPY